MSQVGAPLNFYDIISEITITAMIRKLFLHALRTSLTYHHHMVAHYTPPLRHLPTL